MASALAGCGPRYSPDTYAASAVQQANKVEQGVVVGVRQVGVQMSGTTGAVAGAAAGGAVGAQAGAGGLGTTLTTIGGSLVGGLLGSGIEQAAGNTTAFEYVVRKPNGDLVSVTQRDEKPLAIGQKVLVIAGAQARIVPDYTVPVEKPADKPAETPAGSAAPVPVQKENLPAEPKPPEPIGPTQI